MARHKEVQEDLHMYRLHNLALIVIGMGVLLHNLACGYSLSVAIGTDIRPFLQTYDFFNLLEFKTFHISFFLLPQHTHSTDGGIHNPTYGAEDFLGSPPSSPTPPVYEEVQSPDSEQDCEPEKVFHNPLYGDVTYLPTDEDNTPPNEINHTSAYAMSSQKQVGTNKPAQRTQCRVRFKDEATVLNESGDSSSTMDYSTLDPRTQYASLDPTTQYASLDPTTQYASLEPYVGQSDGDVMETAEVENRDPNDYSHLKH